MRKSKWAQLWSNLPDDSIDENGDVVQFGGQGVCRAIAEVLESMGFQVEGPENAGLNGWELYSVRPKLKVWMQISDLGGNRFLLAVGEWNFFRTARRRQWFLQEFLVPFNEKLQRSQAFSKVGWIDPSDAPYVDGVYSPADPSVPEY